MLGVWLGDGSSRDAIIHLNREDDPHIVGRLPAGHYIKSREEPNSRAFLPDGLWASLRQAGLLNNKHIPPAYMRASVEQKRELIRGLWDTDGCHYGPAGSGCDGIAITNRRIIDGIVEILHSLGLVVRMKESPCMRTTPSGEHKTYLRI